VLDAIDQQISELSETENDH